MKTKLKKTRVWMALLLICCLIMPAELVQAGTGEWKLKDITGNTKVLYVGSTYTIKTTAKTSQLTFCSKNKKVAKVSKKGVVTAKKAGTAKIVITNNKTKEKITLKLVVKKPKLFSVSKKSGTYCDSMKVKLKVKKGYILYYTLNGKFKKSKKVTSSKTITIKKTKTLSVYVVKKGTKISASRMKKNVRTYQYAAQYKYVIQKTTDSEKSTETATSQSTTKATTQKQIASATQENTESTTQKDTESTTQSSEESVTGDDTESTTAAEETTQSAAEENTVEVKKADKVAYTSKEALDESGKEYTQLTIPEGTTDVAAYLNSIEGISVEDHIVTISKDGYYYLSGDFSGYAWKIDIPTDESGENYVGTEEGKVYLTLDGITLSNEDSAVFCVTSADKVVLTLAENSVNTINGSSTYQVYDEQTGAYVDAKEDAALYSQGALTINGTGTLIVNDANGDAIKCKDSLKIISGNIQVVSQDDGITGKDKVAIFGGTIHVTSQGDGIKASKDAEGYVYITGGDITIASQGDAICAESTVYILGGTFDITTGEGSSSTEHTGGSTDNFGPWQNNNTTSTTDVASSKGIKAQTMVQIDGGTFVFDCDDDAIHSNGDVRILGGNYTIQTGDDGIHADQNLEIIDGDINITKSYEGVEAYNIYVKGGKLNVTASDDGVNAAGDSENISDALISISGGEMVINAQGDGLDANGSIKMSGGTVWLDGPTNGGNGVLDYDSTFDISGGQLFFLSAYDRGQTQNVSNSSTQVSVMAVLSSTYAAGSLIEIKTSDGETIMSYTSQKSFSVVGFSTGKLKVGDSCSIYINNNLVQTISVTSTVTSVGTSENQGPGGGFGPGGR